MVMVMVMDDGVGDDDGGDDGGELDGLMEREDTS